MASISDNYEINVARNGKHYCKIEIPEVFQNNAVEKLNELRQIFGNEFELDMTYWVCRGEIREEWK